MTTPTTAQDERAALVARTQQWLREADNNDHGVMAEDFTKRNRSLRGLCPWCGNSSHHSTNGACDFTYRAPVGIHPGIVRGLLTALASPADATIDCPLCGVNVKQVASATLDLALWQHVNWVCAKKSPAETLSQEEWDALEEAMDSEFTITFPVSLKGQILAKLRRLRPAPRSTDV